METVGVGMARFAIYKSHNGADDWVPLRPAEVPEWLTDPEVLGKMRQGFLAHDESKGPEWYCAVELPAQLPTDEAERVEAVEGGGAVPAVLVPDRTPLKAEAGLILPPGETIQ